MSSANANYTELVTTTLENRRRVISNNVIEHNILLSHVKKSGNIDLASGGRELVEELSYAENSTAGWYDGYELINITPQQVHSAAVYSWKQAAASVSISGGELAMNSGREQMIPLLRSRINNAEDSLMNLIADGVYSNGTGDGGKQIGGLQHLVADAPTSGVVGGIDRANFSFWQNAVQDAQGDVTTPDATAIQGHMQSLWLKIIGQPSGAPASDAPDLAVASSNAFTAFWQSLLEVQRITSSEKGASGFRSVEFMGPQGGCPVFFDRKCPTDKLYFLNTKYLKFRPHRDRNFKVTDQRTSINQDAVVVLQLWMGNMTMSNARAHGVLFD